MCGSALAIDSAHAAAGSQRDMNAGTLLATLNGTPKDTPWRNDMNKVFIRSLGVGGKGLDMGVA